MIPKEMEQEQEPENYNIANGDIHFIKNLPSQLDIRCWCKLQDGKLSSPKYCEQKLSL
jgi:hypothetical protein